MKKTGMAKSDAKKLMGKMAAPGAAGFGNSDVTAIDRREQRKRDQALGLVPFAVKLNGSLVQQLQTLAKERELDLNQLVAELLAKGLAD
ncbi:hypothetical protein [Collimonas sp.]|uniref:hypothetical protein n=1 Tax=Collimonas sp. TaxID=1963772 RepID=UPI002B70F72F|nr:hypothetical protein [Collimonas sp.]HWW06774.1 hypothetical protein [Collimonas sp.]